LDEPVDNLVRAFCIHLEAVQSEGAALQTIRLYEGRHKQFLSYLLSHQYAPPFSMELLNASNIRRAAIWIREHSTGSRGGEHAARALISTLKTSSAWLTDEGYIDVDLVSRVKRPRVSVVSRMPFSQPEVRGLVLAALGTRQTNRDVALIHLLLDTGMRVGGLCSVFLEDISLRDHRLELRLKGGRRHVLYFGSSDRRDGGRTVRALKAYLAERADIVARHPNRDQGYLFVGFDGWPLKPGGVRGILSRLAADSQVKHVFPHRFRHTFATWYLVRHPGDETGLRGILGHLSDDMYRVYAHLAHEIIAQRAGRVALSEAWLGEEGVDA
jgi:site-specific recombinase XerD